MSKTLKYDPLIDFFSTQSENSFSLTFDEIEKIINNKLPAYSATPTFWNNEIHGHWKKSRSQSVAWRKNGYFAHYITDERKVLFNKEER